MFGSLTCSCYSAAGQNAVDLYRVVGQDSLLLGAPAHKVTLSTGINVWRDRVALGITAIYMSSRYRAYLDGAGAWGSRASI